MKKLLGTERVGNRTNRFYQHYGDDGKKKITTVTTEDAEPVIKRARLLSETPTNDFKFKATIPKTLIDEACRVKAAEWAITPNEVFAEMMQNKTDRAKAIWRILTEGRDFRKLQRH